MTAGNPTGRRAPATVVARTAHWGRVAYSDRVPGRRSVVDYSLHRRAVLADVYAGRTGLFEVCDASPYLTRAAKYHGETTDLPCPVCRKERLTLVNYVYGDHLGPVAGQAKTQAELARMDAAQEEFSVYAVEVCRGCGWNHLDSSYVLGAEPTPGRSPRKNRRRAATE
jgi:Family of unknown function (DUF5318)